MRGDRPGRPPLSRSVSPGGSGRAGYYFWFTTLLVSARVSTVPPTRARYFVPLLPFWSLTLNVVLPSPFRVLALPTCFQPLAVFLCSLTLAPSAIEGASTFSTSLLPWFLPESL